jgi:tRNA U34 5-carboxymethylaminomethyl modifying GTPase MnmE/TrmE
VTAPQVCQLTAPSSGSIGVLQLWGPGCDALAEAIFTPRRAALPLVGELGLGTLHDSGEPIDEAILVRLADRWEINVHGGELVMRKTLALLESQGCEITDTPPLGADRAPAITAELEEALRHLTSLFAVQCLCHQWSGGLRQLVETMLNAPAPDATALAAAADRFDMARRLLHPPEVILAGNPNAGKSTLFNRLVGRRVAIINARAGTTRDYLREVAHLDGRAVWLTDTAGLWDQATGLDAAGVAIAREQLSRADLVVLTSAETLSQLPDDFDRPVLRVATKSDTAAPIDPFEIALSVETDAGLDALAEAILSRVGLGEIDPATPMAFTARQRDLLLTAADKIKSGDIPAAHQTLTTILRG